MQIDIVQLGVVIAIILFSMTLHELAHGLVAYRLGDDTAKMLGRLSLNPLKHVDLFMTILLPISLAIANLPIFGGAKPVPINILRLRHGEWGMALVAIIGPLTNLLIAFIGFIIFNFSPHPWLGQVVVINLGFFVFNMLPIPPLDGSRLMYALAPEGVQRVMEWVESFGVIVVFAFVLLMSNVLGMVMGRAVEGILYLFQLFVRLF